MTMLASVVDEENQVPEQEENVMLKENNRRFVLFPIQHAHVWHAYKQTEAKFWSAEEIELADDLDGMFYSSMPVSLSLYVSSPSVISRFDTNLLRLQFPPTTRTRLSPTPSSLSCCSTAC
jgi:hypothetical protein